MKLILIAILTALGETMAINSVGSESETGTINKRFQFRDEPKERKPWDSPSSEPSKAPSSDVVWDQRGGTRMFMQNVQVDGPNLDFNDEQLSNNGNGEEIKESAGEVDGYELDFNREFGVPKTVEDWIKILASVHQALPPLIKKMNLTQFWPLKNDFEDGVSVIKKIEGERGPTAFYLQTIGGTFGRADQIAREMCTKNPNVDSGCKSHYPRKN
ncbi:hypothetical protein OXX59_001572 [Metschnikowia pulcherrima]